MAVVFLVGGTGNQFFQYAASSEGDTFSTLFLSKAACRLLGWQHHRQLLAFPKPGPAKHAAAILMLCLDLVLVRLGRSPLFTDFDLRSVTRAPKYRHRISMGYFLHRPFNRDIAPLRRQFRRDPDAAPLPVAVHIRGGDALKAHSEGWQLYGKLRPAYFRRALKRAFRTGQPPPKVTFFTDDPEYCRNVIERIDLNIDYEIDLSGHDVMIQGCLAADTFVACNSSLSWWIVQLRGFGRHSIVPTPFMRHGNLAAPEFAEALPVVLD